LIIEITGGMIVGEIGSKLGLVDAPNGLSEWAEDNDIATMSMHFGADPDCCYYGFSVQNMLVSKIDQAWLDDLKTKAVRFEELTKVPAKLIGAQNVW
jgi:hypothetical protein